MTLSWVGWPMLAPSNNNNKTKIKNKKKIKERDRYWNCWSKSRSVMSDSLWPHGILQARILGWIAFPFSGGSSQLGIKPRSLVLQVNSLSAEPQEKPKNTGVGSLCLLQQIFPTQELNQNQTMVPYIAGGFFTNWAFREALVIYIIKIKFLNLAVIHFLVLNGLTGPFVALFSSDLFTSQKVYSQCP